VTAAKFISDLVAKGRYCFSAEEAAGTLGTSAIATRAALRRLRQNGEVAMPYKGFYIIVPSSGAFTHRLVAAAGLFARHGGRAEENRRIGKTYH